MSSILLDSSHGVMNFNATGLVTVDRVLPSYQPGPYTYERLPHHMLPVARGCIPSLLFYTIQALYPYFDCIEMGDMPRRPYHPDKDLQTMVFLIPTFSDHMKTSDMNYVDPRLWATLIQVYELLPHAFEVYTLPLSDVYLTRLQNVQSTVNFTLITVVDLSGNEAVTDETVDPLGGLLNLAVLDISRTRVTAWGIKKLAMCISYEHEGNITGPTRLRILSLRGCSNVTDEVKPALKKFPLLSVIDFRGTSVQTTPFTGFSPIEGSEYKDLFFPYPSLSWIPALMALFDHAGVFASETSPHMLFVNRMVHSMSSVRRDSQAGFEGDQVAILLPNGKQDVQLVQDVVDEKDAFTATKLNKRCLSMERWKGPMTAEFHRDEAVQKVLEEHKVGARILDFYATRSAVTCISRSHHYITSAVTSHNDDIARMFIRQPPPFDFVSYSNLKPKPKKVGKPDEFILSKRTKLPDGNHTNVHRTQSYVAAGWLNMRSDSSESCSQSVVASQSQRPLPAASNQHQSSVILNTPASGRVNPFRVKCKKLSGSSASSLPIRARMMIAEKESSSKGESSSKTILESSTQSIPRADSHSQSLLKLNTAKKERLKDKGGGFDMKAWATSKSKK